MSNERASRVGVSRSMSPSVLGGVPALGSSPGGAALAGAALRPQSRKLSIEAGRLLPPGRCGSMSFRRSRSSTRSQFTDVCPVSVLMTLTAREVERQEVIFELINTERSFVSDMRTTINVFLATMREKDLLSKKEIGSIFSNLESLVPVNEAILAELNERSADKNVISEVGDIFLSHIGMFKLYAVYCSNQHQVPKRLKEYYERDPELKKTLETLSFKPQCRGLMIEDFLIQPLQRLCKYPLLFESLLSKTDESHPDYANVGAALKEIKRVVDLVNERARIVENVEKLSELQQRFDQREDIDLVQHKRHLVQQTDLSVSKNGKLVSGKDAFTLLLCNDIIVVARVKKGADKWTAYRNAPLGDVLIQAVGGTDLPLSPRGGVPENVYEIDLEVAAEATVRLQFSVEKERDSFVENFRKHRKELCGDDGYLDVSLGATSEMVDVSPLKPKLGDGPVTIGGSTVRSEQQRDRRASVAQLMQAGVERGAKNEKDALKMKVEMLSQLLDEEQRSGQTMKQMFLDAIKDRTAAQTELTQVKKELEELQRMVEQFGGMNNGTDGKLQKRVDDLSTQLQQKISELEVAGKERASLERELTMLKSEDGFSSVRSAGSDSGDDHVVSGANGTNVEDALRLTVSMLQAQVDAGQVALKEAEERSARREQEHEDELSTLRRRVEELESERASATQKIEEAEAQTKEAQDSKARSHQMFLLHDQILEEKIVLERFIMEMRLEVQRSGSSTAWRSIKKKLLAYEPPDDSNRSTRVRRTVDFFEKVKASIEEPTPPMARRKGSTTPVSSRLRKTKKSETKSSSAPRSNRKRTYGSPLRTPPRGDADEVASLPPAPPPPIEVPPAPPSSSLPPVNQLSPSNSSSTSPRAAPDMRTSGGLVPTSPRSLSLAPTSPRGRFPSIPAPIALPAEGKVHSEQSDRRRSNEGAEQPGTSSPYLANKRRSRTMPAKRHTARPTLDAVTNPASDSNVGEDVPWWMKSQEAEEPDGERTSPKDGSKPGGFFSKRLSRFVGDGR